MRRNSRRRFLRWCGAAGLAGLAGCSAFGGDAPESGDGATSDDTDAPTATPTTDAPTATATEEERDVSLELDPDAPVSVRGAIYIPARAFNFYQMWRDYDHETTDRDLGYAERVNLNALRTWASYELWLERPEAFWTAFEDFLATADDHGLKVMFGLFEGIGNEPTRENLEDEDLLTATGVSSPSRRVLENRNRWDEPRAFVREFMDRYADDDRLLAIEVINEPGWNDDRVRFSKSMYETMLEMRGSIPLTLGSTSMAKNARYAKWDLDVFQFHYNFPTSRSVFRDALRQVSRLDEQMDEPVLLTEWQRVRSGEGFHTPPPREERTPGYSTMAPTITEAGMGNFFWSLMVQPAYFSSQREAGIINGLFHEDGAVWSLDDARAIKAMSGDPAYEGEERNAWPKWTEPLKLEVYGEPVETETPTETPTPTATTPGTDRQTEDGESATVETATGNETDG